MGTNSPWHNTPGGMKGSITLNILITVQDKEGDLPSAMRSLEGKKKKNILTINNEMHGERGEDH